MNPVYANCNLTTNAFNIGVENNINYWYYSASTPSSVSTIQPATQTNTKIPAFPPPSLVDGFNDPNLGFFSQSCEGNQECKEQGITGGNPAPLDVLGNPYICMSASTRPGLLGSGNYGFVPDSCMFTNGNLNVNNNYNNCSADATYHFGWKRDYDTTMSNIGFDTCCTLPINTPLSTTTTTTQYKKRSDTCSPDWNPASPFCFEYMSSTLDSPTTLYDGTTIPPPCTYQNWNSNPSTDPTYKGSTCDQYVDASSSIYSQVTQNGANSMDIFRNALGTWYKDLNGTAPSNDDPFLPTIVKYCNNSTDPRTFGICDAVLSQVCHSVPRTSMNSNNLNLTQVCASFLDPSQYLMPGELPIQCDTLYSSNVILNKGIPRYQFSAASGAFQPLVCNQITCLLDDVSVDLVNSINGGDVDFNTICGNCNTGSGSGSGNSSNTGVSCTCVFNGISLNEIYTKVGGNINFSQSCGLCTSGSEIVSCATVLPPNLPPSNNGNNGGGNNSEQSDFQKLTNWLMSHKLIYYSTLTILIILIIVAIYFLLRRKR
jgi:hypothetical protein